MKSTIGATLAVAILPFLVESYPFSFKRSLHRDGKFQHPHPVAPYNLPLKAVPRKSRTSGLRPRGSAAPLIDPDYQRDFLVAVSIGGQTVDLQIDTGSSNTWSIVDGWSCESGWACNFGPAISINSDINVYSNVTFTTSYADKSGGTGSLASATVEVAGITVDNQDVGLVKQLGSPGDGQQSGLIGLAYPSLTSAVSGGNTVTYPSIMYNIFSEGLADSYFSLAISRDASGNGDGGYMSIGGIPDTSDPRINASSSYGTSKMEYDPAFSSSQYSVYYVSVDSIQWLDPSKNTVVQDNIAAPYVIDSGTTLSMVPDADAAAINALFDPPATLSSNGLYMVDCSATTTAFSLTIGGMELPINPADLLTPAGGSSCYSGIQPAGQGNNLVGDSLLRSLLVVFDWGNQALDFYARPEYES